MTAAASLSATRERGSRLSYVLAYGAAYVVLGLSVAALGPTLIGLAEQTGSSLGQVGIVFTASSVGVVVGSLVSGRLFDRSSGHPILAMTLLLVSGLLFFVPFISNRWLLAFDLLVLGVATGALNTGVNTLTLWLFGRAVGPYLNALHFFFGLGAFLAPILIDRMVAIGGGIRWAYYLLALLALPVAFWMSRIPSPSQQGQEEEGQGSSTVGYGWLTFLAAALLGLHVGAELGFGGWVFTYALAVKLGPETTARLLNSVFWGALTIGRLVAVPLAKWLLPRTMLMLDLIGAAVSTAVILLLPGWVPAVWIGTFGLGLAFASFYATVLNFAGRRMPVSGRAMAYILIGGNAGSMTLPWVFGQLFELIGPRAMIGAVGVDIVVSLALFGYMLLYVRRFPVRDTAMG